MDKKLALQFQQETGEKAGHISREEKSVTSQYIIWLESKIKNLSERSEPLDRCCAMLMTPKFKIEKSHRDNYLWVQKYDGEGTEINYEDFDKHFAKMFYDIM